LLFEEIEILLVLHGCLPLVGKTRKVKFRRIKTSTSRTDKYLTQSNHALRQIDNQPTIAASPN